MDYTVIGDGVNLAARLEGATKLYASSILISSVTKDMLTQPVKLRELDWIRVKGKEQPIAVFEVLDALETDRLAKIEQFLPTFVEALSMYRQQKWTEALRLFSSIVEEIEDPASDLYIERCRYFQTNTPEADWDGVWSLRTK